MVGGMGLSGADRSCRMASAVMRMIAGLSPMAAYSRIPTVDWITASRANAGLPAARNTAAVTMIHAATRAAVTRYAETMSRRRLEEGELDVCTRRIFSTPPARGE